MRKFVAFSILTAALSLTACKTANSAADAVKSAGETVANGAGDLASGAVSLVNVNLSNVLNDLSLDLHIDKANIPINAQIPITIAANVCGVSINVLSIGAGGGSSQGCTANSISPELKQYIQQQLAANGSVGGGAQTTQTPATATTPTTTTPTTTTTTPTCTSTDPNNPCGQ
jgi:predicted small secreted protein